ncbi:dodecin family protein [Oerskovia merdavium]|nr:dodecin family protein [Oerskovia merdavium]
MTEDVMSGSVARITQISARSDVSFDDAVKTGIERASETLRNLTGAWVKEQKVEVRDGKIVAWQVALEVTFVLD